MRSVVEKRSYDSVTVFWLDSAGALRNLREAAERLVAARSDVAAVYLFGSLAEGRAAPGSDADLLILLSHIDRRWVDRPLEFYAYFSGVGLPVDLFCYTAEEVDRTRFAQTARQRGVCLAKRVS